MLVSFDVILVGDRDHERNYPRSYAYRCFGRIPTWPYYSSTGFLFEFRSENWTEEEKDTLTKDFDSIISMFTKIGNLATKVSGPSAVAGGLFYLEKSTMTKVMNQIPGMGQTSAHIHTMN